MALYIKGKEKGYVKYLGFLSTGTRLDGLMHPSVSVLLLIFLKNSHLKKGLVIQVT